MLPEETHDRALQLTTEFVDKLSDLDTSIGGYIELLEFALKEIRSYKCGAVADLGEEDYE